MSSMIRFSALVLAAAALAACGDSAPPPPAATGPAAGAAPPAATEQPVPPAPTETVEDLLARANAALAEDKLFEPAGDKALELYLAAIEQAEATAAPAGEDSKGKPARLSDAMASADQVTQTRMAVTDILPYGLVWVERAITNDNRPEAARVLALLERAQPGATSLQRLRDQLAEAELETERGLARAAAAEAAAEAAAANPPPTPEPVAPTPTAAPAVATPAPTTPAPSRPAATTPAPAATTPAATTPAAATPRPATPAAADPGVRPKLVSQPSMRYPTQALRRGTEGVVVVSFTIQPDGTTANARVTSANPRGIFDREALRLVEGLRFQPSGRPFQTQQQIDFKLDQ